MVPTGLFLFFLSFYVFSFLAKSLLFLKPKLPILLWRPCRLMVCKGSCTAGALSQLTRHLHAINLMGTGTLPNLYSLFIQGTACRHTPVVQAGGVATSLHLRHIQVLLCCHVAEAGKRVLLQETVCWGGFAKTIALLGPEPVPSGKGLCQQVTQSD